MWSGSRPNCLANYNQPTHAHWAVSVQNNNNNCNNISTAAQFCCRTDIGLLPTVQCPQTVNTHTHTHTLAVQDANQYHAAGVLVHAWHYSEPAAVAAGCHRAYYRKIWRHPQKWKYLTYCTAARRTDWATATRKMHEYLTFGRVVREICVQTKPLMTIVGGVEL